MNTRRLLGAMLAAGAMAGCAVALPVVPSTRPVPVQPSTPVPPLAMVSGVGLHAPMPGVYTSAQPGAGDWMRLPALGIGTVINLRPRDEMPARDEAAEVRNAGLAYIEIPVTGADAITADNARVLWQALRGARGDVLVHCSTGNRAGALLALAAHADGMPAGDALAFGKAAGLGKLEPVVRQRLGLPAMACPTGRRTDATC